MSRTYTNKYWGENRALLGYYADVSGLPMGSHPQFGFLNAFGFLYPEDGTDRLYRNVGNCYCSPRNYPEERSSHLLRCGSLQYTCAGVAEHRPTVYTRALLLMFE